MRLKFAPRWRVAVVLCLLGFTVLAVRAAEPLPGARRVLFLGDSITYSGQYIEYIEAWFATRFPGRSIELLNLGLPSETVSGLSEPGHADGKFPRPDLHERLDRVLAQVKPDTVVACYGMNDGIYLPFSGERLAAFTNGISWLRSRVTAAGASITHVTPPVFDDVRGRKAGYGNALDQYARWMIDQRKSGWDVADIHLPMAQHLAEKRKTDTNYFLAGDGVHPGEMGHWLMAQAILEHWGATDVASLPDAKAMLSGPNGEAILRAVQQKQRVLKDAWLTATGHKRPGMGKGLPLPEAQQKAAELEKTIRRLATVH